MRATNQNVNNFLNEAVFMNPDDTDDVFEGIELNEYDLDAGFEAFMEENFPED